MLEFWTTWNFAWFLLYRFHLLPFTNALKTSIITTSLVGGCITYFHPKELYIHIPYLVPGLRIMTIRLSYYARRIGDLIVHQYPMFYILTNEVQEQKTCAINMFIPMIAWYYINMKRRVPLYSIYNMNLNNIIVSACMIASTMAIRHHIFGYKSLLCVSV